MDDQFTLGINSNMELLDSNINPSLGEVNPSNFVSTCGFSPLAENNFSDHHQTHDRSLPFMPLSNGTNSNNQIFAFSSDRQVGSFYDPTTHLPTTRDDVLKKISRDKIFGNSNAPKFSSGVPGENKATRNHGYGVKRRKKNNESEVEKPREVVHVRARRGEATDSHSLAERLRREKINGKLQCLQELVPGCYKSMGMSVMLDVTINYIRSLQNQIEFLSMKLSAASMFYEFNSPEMDTMKGTNVYETQVMDRMGVEGYGDLLQF